MSLAREREGDLRLKLDDLDGALQAFTEVRRYRATLLDLRAGTLEVFNEGVSAEKMGNVLERQGKFAEAIRSYEHAQSAYKLVASAEPTNVLFARALAAISGSIGDARWGQKTPPRRAPHTGIRSKFSKPCGMRDRRTPTY